MPTSRTEGEAGFTLVELLAVLVILALAAGAVMQVGRGSVESARVRSFLVEAEAMMRAARNAAIETGAETDVIIDTRERRLAFPAGERSIAVPEGVSLEGEVARLGGPGTVRFFANGGSTGANLSFSFRGQTFELRVNWLTGHADVHRS